MAVVTMKELLEAGVHFGHQTRRWNPKMKPYVFTERNDIYIIDLQKTLVMIGAAFEAVRDNVANGGVILFVGTKKQAQEAVKEHATRCGMPYVNTRWLGGTLTNFNTIHSRILYLDELERRDFEGELDLLPKKEALQIRRKTEKLKRNLEGIRKMHALPDMLFVIDPRKERIAVSEARKLGIPIVGLVDTNCDPDEVDYVIPGNDDAIRAANLMCRIIADAVLEGLALRERKLAEELAGAEREMREKQEVARRRLSTAVPAYSASPDDVEAEGIAAEMYESGAPVPEEMTGESKPEQPAEPESESSRSVEEDSSPGDE